jgi:hypothetical protein
MRGYNDGYDACSSEGGGGSSGDGSCYEIGYEDGTHLIRKHMMMR